jgi:hypothetical protein
MAVLSYFAIVSIAIQAAYSSNPSTLLPSTYIPLAHRKSTRSPQLIRRGGVATEEIKIDQVEVLHFFHTRIILTVTRDSSLQTSQSAGP